MQVNFNNGLVVDQKDIIQDQNSILLKMDQYIKSPEPLKGLRGVRVGYCLTSKVNKKTGVSYCGIPIAELANCKPMEVIYLLLFGKKGDVEEVKELEKEISRRAPLKEKVVQGIRALPKDTPPMQLLGCALLICGGLEKTGSYKEDCLNIIAKIPQIVAEVLNLHAGWGPGENLVSNPELGYIENFLQMLHFPGKSENLDQLTQAFNLFHILHMDHGGGNCSTFTAKTTASTLADMYSSLVAGVCALSGSRHGQANQAALKMFEQLQKDSANESEEPISDQQIMDWLHYRFKNKQLIFGFGHAVLEIEDPRASVLYSWLEGNHTKGSLSHLALRIRHLAPAVLKTYPKVNRTDANVDAVSGCVLKDAGFNYPEYFTVLFALSRIIGMLIQIVAEREWINGGNNPITRPEYEAISRN